VTYLGAAIGIAAFVPQRLSIWRGYFVQLATAFVGVAMPSTVGHIAVNARYLHREKVDEGTIAAAVTVSQLVNIVTTVLLLIVLGVLTGSGLSKFKIAPGGDVLIGLAVIAVAVITVLAVPLTRRKVTGAVWPHLRQIWPRLLEAVSHPVRLGIAVGANLLLTVAYSLALIAALRSVGAHPAESLAPGGIEVSLPWVRVFKLKGPLQAEARGYLPGGLLARCSGEVLCRRRQGVRPGQTSSG